MEHHTSPYSHHSWQLIWDMALFNDPNLWKVPDYHYPRMTMMKQDLMEMALLKGRWRDFISFYSDCTHGKYELPVIWQEGKLLSLDDYYGNEPFGDLPLNAREICIQSVENWGSVALLEYINNLDPEERKLIHGRTVINH